MKKLLKALIKTRFFYLLMAVLIAFISWCVYSQKAFFEAVLGIFVLAGFLGLLYFGLLIIFKTLAVLYELLFKRDKHYKEGCARNFFIYKNMDEEK